MSDFAEYLDDELVSPCPCGSGASSLLCKCDGGTLNENIEGLIQDLLDSDPWARKTHIKHQDTYYTNE